ncbi:MAG: hypothetical protein R3F19_26445 [Verrucomicrobiales bacterium]
MNDQLTKQKRCVRGFAGSFIVLLVLYIGTYILNSMAGGWMVNESGRCRVFGLAQCDQFIWMPHHGFCQKFTLSDGRESSRAWGIGKFYRPLILIDQAYFHPTVRFMNEDLSLVDPLPAPPIEDYHPTRANRFAGRFPY